MTVLIIAEDAEFSHSVVSRWQMERTVPAFAVVSSTVWEAAQPAGSGAKLDAAPASLSGSGIPGQFDLAIIAPMPATRTQQLLQALEPTEAAVVAVTDDAAMAYRWRQAFPRVLTVLRQEGWLDVLIMLASEVLRRLEAMARTRCAEESAAAANRHATLGRFILEMRHSLNNALTSVLGNAELMLLEPGTLSAEVRDQVTTIHSMALRMHEILQRFSSLDAEMQFAEKQSQHETQIRPRAAGEQS